MATHFLLSPSFLSLPLLKFLFFSSRIYTLTQTLAHEREVLKEGLQHLTDVLTRLDPLHESLGAPGGSVLLEELVQACAKSNALGGGATTAAGTSGTAATAGATTVDPLQSATLTPLLHAMSAAHAYIILFVHVCRTGQSEIRNLSVSHWGSELGITVLQSLSRLYTSLVWESTVLLALCSESTTNASWAFGRHQLERLASYSKEESVSAAATASTAAASTSEVMEVDDPLPALTADASTSAADGATAGAKKKVTNTKLAAQIKQIKPLLSSASRLGRALAELFGLLVKLCVGSPIRHRRSHQSMPNIPVAPSPPAKAVAIALTKLLANGLSWVPPETSPIPKFR